MQVDSNSCHPELPAALGCARCAQLHKLTFRKASPTESYHLVCGSNMATMLRVLLAASILSLASCTPESGNWLFHYTGIMPPIKSIPAVVYVTKAVLGEVTSGCGASNQKCNCTVSQYDGDQGLYYGFNMAGQGTDGTATGAWVYMRIFYGSF